MRVVGYESLTLILQGLGVFDIRIGGSDGL